MGKVDLRLLLDYIDPVACTYEEWVNIGQALHEEGYPVDVWDTWSAKDVGRYHDGECEKKWESFGRYTGNHVTGATITQMAKENGWIPRSSDPGKVFGFNSVISATEDYKVVDVNYLDSDESIDMPRVYDDKRRKKDLLEYLRTIYAPEEYVGYVVSVFTTADGRKSPSKGNYQRTAGELIDALSRTDNIANVLGDYDKEAGAWIRFNPLDGKGVKNDNVTSYRYTLIESDAINIGKQKAILEKLELPIAAMVYSGGKSIHAIVRVEAHSYEEYRKRVEFIYKVVAKNGFTVDSQNRNPSRLSRMPGILRNGKPQFLISTNIGKATYEEWEEWINDVNDDLSEPEGLDSVWDAMPELAPPLIDGVLREGHKMLVAGPSKAGKSFALIQLCVAIAEGRPWFGFPCTQGKVLYVNLEVDRASCLHRFKDVYNALQQSPSNLKNIEIWNLRGKSLPMDALAPKLIRRSQKKGYKAIVIDPIYKVITGDENSAEQMAKFCSQFDRLAAELQCAVIYCHHHSKGSQSQKRSMDRASGSGVFARDPDALLDLIQLDVKEDAMENQEDGVTAWRLEGTLREFKAFRPINVWFKYPIHEVDTSGILAMATLDNPQEKGNYNSARKRQAIKQNKKDKLVEAFNAVAAFNGSESVSVEAVANYLNVSEKTVRRYLQEMPIFKVEMGELKITDFG